MEYDCVKNCSQPITKQYINTWSMTFYRMVAGIKWQPPYWLWGEISRVFMPQDWKRGGTSGASGTCDSLQVVGLLPEAGGRAPGTYLEY